MKISLPHGMTKERAVEKLKLSSPDLVKRFGSGISALQQEWDGGNLNFSFETYGFNVSGRIVIDMNNIELDAKLPLMAKPFEGRIRGDIEQVVREILEHN